MIQQLWLWTVGKPPRTTVKESTLWWVGGVELVRQAQAAGRSSSSSIDGGKRATRRLTGRQQYLSQKQRDSCRPAGELAAPSQEAQA
jgi:hypothetical protein